MELSFVVNALRRYKWVPIVFVLLGAFAGFSMDKRAAETYSSDAIMLVTPPSDQQVVVSFNNDPDRYAVSQLSVLRSAALAEKVATEVGGGIGAAYVSASVTISHEPKTDIFHVTAKTPDPQQSMAIANAYVELYFDSIQQAVTDAQAPELKRINDDLADIKQQLDDVNAQIKAVMDPYVPDNPGSDGARVIPTLEQVAPELETTRTTLTAEYAQISASKNQFEIDQRLRVTSRVIQRDQLPTDPDIQSGNLLYVGIIGGLFLGAVAAVVLGRTSPRVLDTAQAADILGQPIVGRIPRLRELAKAHRLQFIDLPPAAATVIDALCVRAESSAPPGVPFVVLVTGAERSSGATTLAMAMAARYAMGGSHVLLIDADVRHPELSQTFARGRPGIEALTARANGIKTVASAGGRGAAAQQDPFAPTPVPGLSVVGLGGKSSTSPLQRQNVLDVVEAAKRHSQVVIFDGGPLLDSATTVRLASVADVVVLAVPVERQRTDALGALGRQIAGSEVPLLVVDVPATRAARASALETVADEPDVAVDVQRPSAPGDRARRSRPRDTSRSG